MKPDYAPRGLTHARRMASLSRLVSRVRGGEHICVRCPCAHSVCHSSLVREWVGHGLAGGSERARLRERRFLLARRSECVLYTSVHMCVLICTLIHTNEKKGETQRTTPTSLHGRGTEKVTDAVSHAQNTIM